ncbi:signal recognition particle-docking protein FtsY [Gammaproteobacteria bacterium 53_120_T64]|nr:signal recognition particle-docking protein FtsY [Gammaproteobacteria bacterium 53_120_T64]
MSSEQDSSPKPEKRGLFSRWRRKNKAVEPAQPAVVASQNAPPAQQSDLPQEPLKTPELSEPLVRAKVEAAAVEVTEVVTQANTPVEPEAVAEVPAKVSVPVATPVQNAPVAVSQIQPVSPAEQPAVEKIEAQPLGSMPGELPIKPEGDKAENKKRPNRFSRALSRTSAGLGAFFLGRKEISDELLEELETLLLMADVGVDVTTDIIGELTARVKRGELNDSDTLKAELHRVLLDIVSPCEQALDVSGKQPFVLLVVGVNGVGKTTTIGKLAQRFQREGRSVMLAAGDTFRAAAVEQLQVWGERNDVAVVAQHTGADSASVIYDAIESAKAKNIDVLIADTAGRLHTKSNLMEELEKVKRVMAKLDEAAPHEVLLVLDAGTGQNALNQMHEFNQAVGITGLALTKLDGTAKGGVAFALSRRFKVPLRYVGLGEGVDDLQVFRAEDYVKAVLSDVD